MPIQPPPNNGYPETGNFLVHSPSMVRTLGFTPAILNRYDYRYCLHNRPNSTSESCDVFVELTARPGIDPPGVTLRNRLVQATRAFQTLLPSAVVAEDPVVLPAPSEEVAVVREIFRDNGRTGAFNRHQMHTLARLSAALLDAPEGYFRDFLTAPEEDISDVTFPAFALFRLVSNPNGHAYDSVSRVMSMSGRYTTGVCGVAIGLQGSPATSTQPTRRWWSLIRGNALPHPASLPCPYAMLNAEEMEVVSNYIEDETLRLCIPGSQAGIIGKLISFLITP